jgi:voltage-gated potassium channel
MTYVMRRAEPVTTDRRAQLLARWREWTDLPLMMLTFAAIPLLLVEFIVDPTGTPKQAIESSYALIWVFFVADYLIELILVRDRRAYVQEEWLPLVVNVLTIPVLPAAFQALRSLRLLRFVRGVRLGAAAVRGGNEAVALPSGANAQLLVGGIVFATVVLLSAVLELAVEQDHTGAEITDMNNALWWSVGTLTTIGYGDVVPKTVGGRFVAILAMVAALGFVGVVAANLASRLFGRLARTPEEELLGQVLAKLDQLDDRLDRIESSTARPGGTDETPPTGES